MLVNPIASEYKIRTKENMETMKSNKKFYIIIIAVLLVISIFLAVMCIRQNNTINHCDQYVYTSIDNTLKTTLVMIDDGDYQSVIPMVPVIADCARGYSDNTKGNMLSNMADMYIEDINDAVNKQDKQELKYMINALKEINSWIYNDVDYDELRNKVKEFTGVE